MLVPLVRKLLWFLVLLLLARTFMNSSPSLNTAPLEISYDATKLTNKSATKLIADRTAVIITTRFLNNCTTERLRHLIETAGSSDRMHKRQRDIVVLHNHASLPVKSTKLAQSQLWIGNISGLKAAPQASDPLEKFDTRASGSSKSSFLRFVVENNYSYAWHLEDDILYTGRWEEVFDDKLHSDDAFDVVTILKQQVRNWSWYTNKRMPCTIAITKGGEKQRYQCQDIEMIAVKWSVIRISLRFAQSLLADLESGTVTGHHEAVVAPYSKVQSFRMQHLSRVGSVENGGWGKWKSARKHTLKRHNPKPHHLYHPVKCRAHSTPIDWQYLQEHLIYNK